ncbi:NAD(P)H-dependent oxidoreductase [Chitinilyticum piscinae]|uniref:NAD(P)H-dependent oxidoreductase n=1 Tax=Chitinilyticum piscinae TaxID=2866724 RepID=A0A8J7K1W8_9NEIS|nr:NAD(P)H-dependent oxidoreductase [Chitinilyticum piscinae]MBE9609202.1 NAD(P)H-dependent oxidoreductase [Chitinilyticum piscinae]
MRNLVIFSHPHLATSRVHRTLIDAIDDLPDVQIHHLEAVYSHGDIDTAAEQEACEHAARLIFQFPFYWFSSPPMLKLWMDEVLSFGWAFGKAQKLRGKPLQLIISSGGPECAYTAAGYHHHTIEQLLSPFGAMAHLTGMVLQTPLILHGVPNIPGIDVSESQLVQVQEFAQRYRALLLSPHSRVRALG